MCFLFISRYGVFGSPYGRIGKSFDGQRRRKRSDHYLLVKQPILIPLYSTKLFSVRTNSIMIDEAHECQFAYNSAYLSKKILKIMLYTPKNNSYKNCK